MSKTLLSPAKHTESGSMYFFEQLLMNISTLKGFLLAAVAAAAYGTNPAFAVPLYETQAMDPTSVLFYRYLFGVPFMGAIMAWRGVSFKLTKREIFPTIILGLLMALSSLGLFESYKVMNSGVASTLLFVYPIMVAVIMIVFYRERIKPSVILCLAVMSSGLVLLMGPTDGVTISTAGVVMVMLSSLAYAIYIVFVNVSRTVKNIPTSKLLFYVLGSGTILFAGYGLVGNGINSPADSVGWLNLVALALIPTVISISGTTRAIQLIGPTPTAIFGALEPVAAVVLSILVLNQTITTDELLGGVLIVIATTIVVADKTVDRVILHVRKFFPRRHRQ